MADGGKSINALFSKYFDLNKYRTLHWTGPVASSKSTIARLLKKGLEKFSETDPGAMFTFQWKDEKTGEWQDCPMHEEPLRIIPAPIRKDVIRELLGNVRPRYRIDIEGEL